jgi:hypothetical protein
VESIVKTAKRERIHPSELTEQDWKQRRTEEIDELDLHIAGGWRIVHDEASAAIPLKKSASAAAQDVDVAVDAQLESLQVRQLKKANKELAGEVARLKEAHAHLARLQAQPIVPAQIQPRERASGEREGTVVVLCSDWHCEENVNPEAVNGRNAYNTEIARRRVRKLVEGILWQLEMHRGAYQIRDMVLGLLGDMISGYLRDEDLETNELSPIEATMLCQDLIVGELLTPLLAHSDLERIVVPCCYGNHGRLNRRKQFRNAAENSLEWGMYHAIRSKFASEPRLHFQVERGAHTYVDVYDWRIRFHHGDYVRFYGGIGGPLTPVNKSLLEWNKNIRADLTCIGHFHQYLSAEHVVFNGSLIGWNEFAVSLKAAYEPPQQAFFLVDKARGKRNSTKLWVDDERLEGTRR